MYVRNFQWNVVLLSVFYISVAVPENELPSCDKFLERPQEDKYGTELRTFGGWSATKCQEDCLLDPMVTKNY